MAAASSSSSHAGGGATPARNTGDGASLAQTDREELNSFLEIQLGVGRKPNAPYARMRGWASSIITFVRDVMFVSAAPPEDVNSLGSFDSSDVPSLLQYSSKFLEKEEGKKTLRWAHAWQCRKVLEAGNEVLVDFAVDDSVRRVASISDATMVIATLMKTRKVGTMQHAMLNHFKSQKANVVRLWFA
jgi:hypothetical protein